MRSIPLLASGKAVAASAVDTHGPSWVEIPTSPWPQNSGPECRAYRSVSSIGPASCSVCVDGNVYCWGDVESRVLRAEGQSEQNETYGWRKIQGIADALEVSANLLIACVLRTGGRVSCWGAWNEKPLAGISALSFGALFDVPLAAPAVSVVVGNANACALLNTKEVVCWGDNRVGECGSWHLPAWVDAPHVLPGVNAERLSLHGSISCAVDEAKRGQCWGWNGDGSLGTGNDFEINGPIRIVGLKDAVEIQVGPGPVCAQVTDGNIWCWGGKADDAFTGRMRRPSMKASPHGKLIGTNQEEFVILASDHSVYLVDLETSASKKIDRLPPVRMLSGGLGRYCAVLLDGDLRCWGDNNHGDLILKD